MRFISRGCAREFAASSSPLYYSICVPLFYILHELAFVNTAGLVMPLGAAVNALLTATALSGLYLLYAFFYETVPRLFKGFLVLGIAAFLLYLLVTNNARDVYIFEILVAVEALRIVILAIWRKIRWAWPRRR